MKLTTIALIFILAYITHSFWAVVGIVIALWAIGTFIVKPITNAYLDSFIFDTLNQYRPQYDLRRLKLFFQLLFVQWTKVK